MGATCGRTWLLQVAESSGCSAIAVFFYGAPSHPVVGAADAGIFMCSGCLREARVTRQLR